MSEQSTPAFQPAPSDPSLHRFREEAMATHFECWIRHPDPSHARSAASWIFRELQRIEDRLSRFRDGSDVACINGMKTGETLLISETCHACLVQAMELQMITGGIFDIATGGFMELLRDPQGNPVTATPEAWNRARERRSKGRLQIDPELPRVSCLEAGLQLDLGGIGKGFALDVLSTQLLEMEVKDFLLSAGGSTLRGCGAQTDSDSGWVSRLSGAEQALECCLRDACLSSSGFEVKGAHIVHQGQTSFDARWKRVWVKGPHAALVDGLSTACFLMDRAAIAGLMHLMDGQIEVWVETHEGEIRAMQAG